MTKNFTKGQLSSAILASLPGTQADIRNRTGASKTGIARVLHSLSEMNDVHIGGWLRTDKAAKASAVYHAGPGANIKRSVLAAAETEAHEFACAQRERAMERVRRASALAAPARRDPLVAAFFGPSGKA